MAVQVIDQTIPPASWFLSGIISATGSVIALSIDARCASFSRGVSVFGGILGIVSAALGTELASGQLIEEEKKIHSLINISKICKTESIQSIKENLKQLQKIEYHLKAFVFSLNSEQADDFLLVIGEHQLIDREPLSNRLCASFRLTEKQNALISAYSKIEKGGKGFEIFCKFSTAGEKKEKLIEFLSLNPLQKQLYQEFLASIDQVNEEIIFSLIQSYHTLNLGDQFKSYLANLNKAQTIFLFATPLFALLKMVHPSRFFGVIQPLSAIWTLLHVGSLLAAAATISYIFYQCFFSEKPEQLQCSALEILEINDRIKR
ncbi:MAG TPA: hypothetical protein VLE96_01415 [Chlamydiales bacterium]|nr:hypothetical protein [Chlamydiales bacterium]